MALTKREFIQSVNVLADGQMEVRTVTEYLEDDEVISESSKVKFIDTDEGVTGENELVRDIANGTLRTPQRKAARDLVRRPFRADDPAR